MQKEIRQERACNTTLRGAFRPLKEGTIRTFDRGTQPPANIQTDPGKISVVRNSLFDQVMRDGIKKGFDVQIYNPVECPAPFPRHTNRIQRRSAGTVAIRVGVEDWFHLRLQHHLCDCLRHAIGDRRNAERPCAASVLLYLDKPHRRRKV